MIDYEIRCTSKIDLDTTHGVLKAAECKTFSKSSKCLYESKCFLLCSCYMVIVKMFSLDYLLEYDKKSYK